MTINELIRDYKNRILIAKDKKAITRQILNEINNLTYSSDNSPISVADKKKILTGLHQELFTESVIVHSQDNSEHLELINQAINLLGGK